MSFSPLNNNAKEDTKAKADPLTEVVKETIQDTGLPDEEIEQDIGGTDAENGQVSRALEESPPVNDIGILPLNISINQIDELFPKLDKTQFNENNFIALINYLQTYHFALKQLQAQLNSAQNTIVTYEEDIRQLNEFRDAVSNESSDYHQKSKQLEDENRLLKEYGKNLRMRFAKYVGEQFSHGFERMKEADAITNLLSNEFTYQKPQSDHNHE